MTLNFEAEAKTYKVKAKNHEAETESNIPVKSWPKFGSNSNVI